MYITLSEQLLPTAAAPFYSISSAGELCEQLILLRPLLVHEISTIHKKALACTIVGVPNNRIRYFENVIERPQSPYTLSSYIVSNFQ